MKHSHMIKRGGNTTLFRLQNGKQVKRKDVLGGGIFSSLIRGVTKHAPKIIETHLHYLKLSSG